MENTTSNALKPAKILLMGLLSAIAWISDWLLLRQVVYQNRSLTFIGWPSLLTIFGIIFLTFFFLVNKNKLISIILDAIIIAAYIMIMPKDAYVILGGGIFLIFLILFEMRLRAEEKNSLDFSIRRIMSGSVSLVLYALLLLIGFNIYYNTQTDFKAHPEAYYETLTHVTLKTATYVTDTSDQSQANLIAATVVNKIRQSVSGYQQYFPFLFAFIITATLLTFAFLIRWATMVLGWAVFRILLSLKFFKLNRIPVEVEKLEV